MKTEGLSNQSLVFMQLSSSETGAKVYGRAASFYSHYTNLHI